LALELHGANIVRALEATHKLRIINTEINGLKRELESLEKRKIELIEIQKQASGVVSPGSSITLPCATKRS
jgi:hypothetical protein